MMDYVLHIYDQLYRATESIHNFLVTAGILFLILVAVLWNAVANHFLARHKLVCARQASAVCCLVYSLLRTQSILEEGTTALLATAIHVYLMYHITYPLFVVLLSSAAYLVHWLKERWFDELIPSLNWLGSLCRYRRERLRQRLLDELRAPEIEKQRRENIREEKRRLRTQSRRKQLQYELNLQYQRLPQAVRSELTPEIYSHLCQDATDIDDIPTMEDQVAKLHQLLLDFGSGTRSTPAEGESRIDQIGTQFAAQREHIETSSAYDEAQKDRLRTFLNRLEGVELENYLKERIRGVSD